MVHSLEEKEEKVLFNLTLTQSQEYVANLGAAIWPSGGNSANSGDGGGGSFFYKGGELLVASGGGSGAYSSEWSSRRWWRYWRKSNFDSIWIFSRGESSANNLQKPQVEELVDVLLVISGKLKE